MFCKECMMIKKLLVICTALIFVVAVFSAVQAGNAEDTKDTQDATHAFVGVKKCKICHKKDGTHPGWEATPHAGAFDKLPDDKKADKVCLACHSTGVTAKEVLLEGVQCEACHGAGADYKKKKVMEDREASVAAGMNIPDEKTCLKCHGAEKYPDGHKEMAKFDFAKMKEKGVHAMKVAEESK